MVLKIIILILLIVGLIILLAGTLKKKKKLIIFSIILIIIIIVISLMTLDLHIDNSNNQENITNGISEKYDDIRNDTILYGQISKIENDKLYIMNNDNKTYILYTSTIKQIRDGRTNETYSSKQLKEGDYIKRDIQEDEYLIFKNIDGDELKKELLISLSLSKDVNLMKANIDEIKEVEQLGNNEAIATVTISDSVISSDYFKNVNNEEHKFDVKLKFTNKTKYNTNFYGVTVYNAETLENAKNDAMYYLKLDSNTIDNQYPEVLEFDSYSN